jgi:hypothetical protein
MSTSRGSVDPPDDLLLVVEDQERLVEAPTVGAVPQIPQALPDVC